MTLRGVEQASRRFPEPIAFDYLARLERGTLMPSVPKLATLANVYQRPLLEFVDLYELEHLKSLVPEQEGDFGHFRQVAIDYRLEGDHWRSAGGMLRGLDAARGSGDIDVIAQALTSVGIGLIALGRYHAAQRFLEEGLRVVRSDRIRGYALYNLGLVHFHLENLILAELFNQKASEYVGDDLSLQADIHANRGAIFADRGRYEDAARMTRQALEEYRSLGNNPFMTLAMYNLGSQLVKAGQHDEGLTVLRESMSLSAELGDPRLRAMSTLFYGRALYMLGRYEEAVSPLKAAFLIARDREMSQQAFDASFYLWKLSDERGLPIEGDWQAAARRYRPLVEQRSEETAEFDAYLADQRKKPRPGRKPKGVM